MTRREMKQKAKHLLRGVWGRAVALVLFSFLLFVFFSSLEQLIVSAAGKSTVEQIFTPFILYGSAAFYPSVLIFASIIFVGCQVLFFLVRAPFSLGSPGWYYKAVCSGVSPVSSAFFWYTSFKRWIKALAFDFLLLIKKLFWLFLFLLPAIGTLVLHYFAVVSRSEGWIVTLLLILLIGFTALGFIFSRIVCYRYFLVCYLLAEDPSLKLRAAFRNSVTLLKGKKGDLFRLDLSFLPYFLSNLLIFPLLGTVPYIEMTRGIFARELINDLKQNPPEEGDELLLEISED